jgi:mannose-6-phosphate isomerase-like protein (cupin superfamily)
MDDHVYAGVPRGKAGLYADGATPALRKLQVGRFLLSPGQEPHPPHRHVDEEVLIVSRGKGEVIVDGKTTPVTDGAVMYTDPNVEHGIKNTGDRPLEFYWIKYIPQPR